MSKGRGHIQRAIAAAFAAEPDRSFRVFALAELAYPGECIEKRHTDVVDRALRKLAPELGLSRCRVRPRKETSWHNSWGLAAKPMATGSSGESS